MPRPLLSHIDLRLSDRARSTAFYDRLLGALGFSKREGEHWTSYYDASLDVPGPADFEWFGFTQDARPQPNGNRIAFAALTNAEVDRVATLLDTIGATHIDGPNYDEGPGYYAIFFADLDGHLLEVCCRAQ